MPATSSPEEQAIDREYPQRHRHHPHQELGPLQHNHNVAEFQSRLHCQQNQSSRSTLQHQTSQQDLRHSYPQSNTHLAVPSVSAAGSTSRSSSISPIPTPSISPPASAISIDALYSPRDCSPPVPTPSSIGTEAYGSHPQRDSYDRNSSGRHNQDNVNFESHGRNPANMASWSGQPAIRGNSEAVRMILLSFVTIGITFTWGIEMTYCTPYLLNLGLTKSNTSLVWIAGPLSGLIVQPVVGVIADEIMSCSKSLIVDTLPIDKQQTGAAWSSRMSAIGHMIAYGAGAVDLLKLFGTTLGDTQFKQLTVISTIALLSSTSLTCWAVTERVLVASKPTQHEGRFKVFRQIWSTLLNLPPRIQAICWAQFWAWIGWFPFLFYSTTWVGETYFRYDVPADARKSKDTLGAIGRIGSTALVMYSVITFAGAWILPMFVQSPEDNSFTHRPPQAIAGFLTRFNKVKPDLLTAWMLGHIMFAASMSLAPFATSFRFATVLVCLCGIPWTLAMWAPSAFLGVEVNKLGGGAGSDGTYRRISDEPDIELSEISHDDAPLQLDHGSEVDLPSTASTGELSGIYFGILNIYTTLPQFVGTFISTIVFAVLEPGKSPELAGDEKKQPDPDGPNAIAVCLFIGAMSSLVAAYVTRKLKVM
ncbi:hypothetical protein FOTG_08767 [Fusarium oxysporum f. sp. vasinfectum 25433]|nr:hypothetical protein FOTG_08767 [Fusarium oxysporum f. sp. vasinfectum 25433]